MRALLAVLLVFAATFTQAQQRAKSFRLGEVLQHQLSVCVDKDVAIGVVRVDAKHGSEAAQEMFSIGPNCATVVVNDGSKVGRPVFTAQIERAGKKLPMHVIEIVGTDGKVEAYFFSVLPYLEGDHST